MKHTTALLIASLTILGCRAVGFDPGKEERLTQAKLEASLSELADNIAHTTQGKTCMLEQRAHLLGLR